MYKILFADDEIKLRQAVKDYFGAKGIEVSLAENGKQAVEKAEKESFDLIILDVMMPVMNGLEACKEIRKALSVPILFLSALGEERDLLGGYASGADDYIIKPFPLSVLYEKCLSVIRRQKGIDRENKVSVSGITLDYMRQKAFCGSDELELRKKDFEILSYLILNKNMVLSRSIILSAIWGYDFDGDDRVVDTHIKNIRKALGEKGKLIKTVIGVGYCFEEER